MSDDKEILCLETEISDVLPGRESKSGTPYCALILPNGEWVFVWEGHWKTEIEDHIDSYRGLDAELYVIDKEDDPDDHFYNLEAVVPQSEEEAERFLQRNQAEDNHSNNTDQNKVQLPPGLDEVTPP